MPCTMYQQKHAGSELFHINCSLCMCSLSMHRMSIQVLSRSVADSIRRFLCAGEARGGKAGGDAAAAICTGSGAPYPLGHRLCFAAAGSTAYFLTFPCHACARTQLRGIHKLFSRLGLSIWTPMTIISVPSGERYEPKLWCAGDRWQEAKAPQP